MHLDVQGQKDVKEFFGCLVLRVCARVRVRIPERVRVLRFIKTRHP